MLPAATPIAGVEVKREPAVGELSQWRAAALPFFAAGGGMLMPALVAIAVSGGAAAHDGAWAIPVATDIAFALGVLALAGAALPSGVRVLLLSMAVIDDLAAIALVAVLFTSGLSAAWLAAAAGAAALFRLACTRAASTPRSPASCSACSSPSPPGRASSTACTRSRPAS